MALSDLERKARLFTDGIQSLLNRTLCDNAIVRAVDTGLGRVLVGTHMDKLGKTRAVPLRASGKTCCYLEIQGRVFLDPSSGHLTVDDSYFGISTDQATDQMLFHYDYQRGKVDFPEAHLQMFGENTHFEGLLASCGLPKLGIERLHFPLGGKRFRPALEDILEFLVGEKLASLRDDSKAGLAEFRKLIDDSRGEFRRRQLSAAVRGDQETAKAALEAEGWTVTRGDEKSKKRKR